MTLVPVTQEQLNSDHTIRSQLKGKLFMILDTTGGMTGGYFIQYFPDVGQVVLRDKVSGIDRRIRLSNPHVLRILIDDEDHIHVSN